MRAAFVAASLLLLTGCADQLAELLGEESPTPTPTATATPTPTADPDPTPSSTTTNGDITTLDWGTRALPANPNQGPRFTFDAPANVIGMDFIVHGAAADQSKIFAFFDMRAPGNRIVIDGDGDGPVRQGYNDGAMSFSLPADDSSTSAVAAGTWEFRVATFNASGTGTVSSNPRILVKIRTAPAGVPDGLLDMNVIVVDGIPDGSGDLTAAELAASGHWSNAMAEVTNDYATIGISIGDVQFYDLNQAGFATIDSIAEMNSLFELSAQLADQRVNLFIVDDLAGELNSAAGVAGGVPIPMDYNGTKHSGVVIALQSTGNETGEVVAHEMGHSLGLFHTTEFDTSQDPISDTPTCPNIQTNIGACPDRTYVMFPQITGQFAQFSPGQGTVVRAAIHVRNSTSFAPPQVFERTPEDIEPFEYWCHDGVIWKVR